MPTWLMGLFAVLGSVLAASTVLLFVLVLFAVVREQRHRRHADAHAGPLPPEVYQQFGDSPTGEALERLYAIPAVEPEHERWR